MPRKRQKKNKRRYDCMGLLLTCSNDAALDMYDKAICALITLDTRLLRCANKALELDRSLVLMNCMMSGIWLAGLKPPTDPAVAPRLEALKAAGPHITDREKAHIRAVMMYADGNLPGAIDEWMDILIHYPRDILAIGLVFGSCIAIGAFEKMRDSLARLLPWWTEDMSLYPHILSLYAFSLEETNERSRAEELARRALAMDPSLAWGYHTLCHVIEEDQEVQIGVELLTSTRPKWVTSPLGGHISWHLALYYLDLGDISSVLREFDTVLYDQAVPSNLLGLVDAASLLWRLNVIGADPGEKRWEKVINGFSEYIGHHSLSWYDAHAMMSLAHGNATKAGAHLAIAERMLKTFTDYSKSNVSTDSKIADTLGVPVCTALLAFGKEQYDDVISLMLPLKYDLVKLGGSWTQRQVFSITLIHAAIRSKQLPLALALVAELKAWKPKSVALAKLFQDLQRTYELKHGETIQPN